MERQVVVVGAGVVGLTTALQLQQKGFHVIILAHHFPGELDKDYTSPWAGAHWRSYADNNDARQQKLDTITYKKFIKDAQTNSAETGIWMVDAFDYWDKLPEKFEEPWFKVLTPGYRHLSKQELPIDTEFGTTYKSITINTPKYLTYLLHSFTALGGKFDRRLIQHIDDAMLPGVDVVVNCTGLGARILGGVEDHAVYPVRGQTVVIEAPHVDFTFERYTAGNGLGTGTISYVIPRDNGEVILGGTYDRHSFDNTINQTTSFDIIQRCVATRPDLLADLKGVKILRNCVGFRPSRKGGIRLETERRVSPSGKAVLVCHNYGHGGYGVQSSWGSGEVAVELVEKALKQHDSKL